MCAVCVCTLDILRTCICCVYRDSFDKYIMDVSVKIVIHSLVGCKIQNNINAF